MVRIEGAIYNRVLPIIGEIRYTQPSLIRPSLIRFPPSTGHLSGDVAMVNMVLTCTETRMLGHNCEWAHVHA